MAARLATAALSAFTVAAAPATLVKLTASYPNTKCLDGSDYGIYVRPGQGAHANSWLINFEGGGFCTVLDEPFQGTTSCAGRANGDLGSSSGWPATATNGGKGVSTGGLLTDNKAQNPYMWDWSFAFFPYCDGGSFTTNQTAPINVTTPNKNGNQLWFRGAENLAAAVDYLKKNHGMASADAVVVSGCSAGGTSTYLQLDNVAAMLPGQKVYGLADSGYVQNLVTEQGDNFTHIRYQNASKFWGNPFVSNAACQAVHNTPDDAWVCLTPQYVYTYVKTPMFNLVSGYDPGLSGDMGIKKPCVDVFTPACTPNDKQFWEWYFGNFSANLAFVSSSPRDGIWLSACSHHCQSLGGTTSPWTNFNIQSTTPAAGFNAWLTGGSSAAGAKMIDKLPYPSNPSCINKGAGKGAINDLVPDDW